MENRTEKGRADRSTQTFVSSFASALSGGLIGLILTVTGYTPGQVQTGTTLMAFHMMMTLVVAAAFALAMVNLCFYGLTEEVHAGIVKELEAESRNEGGRGIMKRDEEESLDGFSVTGRNKEKARVMASPFRKKPGKDESRDYEEYRLSLNGSWDFYAGGRR